MKAFAATNASRISEMELEEELARELDQSVPLILEELDKTAQDGGGGAQRKGSEATR